VKGFFGYVGGATLGLTDIGLRASMDLPYASKAVYGKDINDIPGMSSLYARENKPQIIDSFFKFNAEVDKVNRTYGEYKKTGRREEAREYKQEGLNKQLMKDSVRKDLHHMSTKVSDLKEKRKKIMETPNERISPEAKKERVDRIDERILHVIKNIDRLQGRVYK
jgi:lysyl-tRNA synthetase class I